jgi:hypothetical protein
VKFVRDSGGVLNGAPQFVGRPEGELQWQGRRLPGVAEQNVGIFCLSGFVADRGRICFSRGSLPRSFLRVRDPSVPQRPSRYSPSLYTDGAHLLLIGRRYIPCAPL